MSEDTTSPDNGSVVIGEKIPETPLKRPDPFPKADLTDFANAELIREDIPGNLVVQRWTAEELTAGGIFLPSIAQTSQAVGWIVKLSSDVPLEELSIGDTLIFSTHAIQALPEVGGLDDRTKHFTEYNYMRARDGVLRYPLHLTKTGERTAKAHGAYFNDVVESLEKGGPE